MATAASIASASPPSPPMIGGDLVVGHRGEVERGGARALELVDQLDARPVGAVTDQTTSSSISRSAAVASARIASMLGRRRPLDVVDDEQQRRHSAARADGVDDRAGAVPVGEKVQSGPTGDVLDRASAADHLAGQLGDEPRTSRTARPEDGANLTGAPTRARPRRLRASRVRVGGRRAACRREVEPEGRCGCPGPISVGSCSTIRRSRARSSWPGSSPNSSPSTARARWYAARASCCRPDAYRARISSAHARSRPGSSATTRSISGTTAGAAPAPSRASARSSSSGEPPLLEPDSVADREARIAELA